MEIVIKIPDGVYQKVNDGEADEFTSAYVVGAVLDGTPLPKGHGDLIDSTKLRYKVDEDGKILITSETIIEADKESEE